VFVEGVVIGFLSPQAAALCAAGLVGLMLEAPEFDTGLSLVAVATAISVSWYAVVAALFSHPIVRTAALRRHRVICRTAAAILCFMALYSALPTGSAQSDLALPVVDEWLLPPPDTEKQSVRSPPHLCRSKARSVALEAAPGCRV